jgi:hypothetical protein
VEFCKNSTPAPHREAVDHTQNKLFGVTTYDCSVPGFIGGYEKSSSLPRREILTLKVLFWQTVPAIIIIVVVAGYTDKMESFVESNPGLRSRFNTYLRFDDYSPLELVAIFNSRPP